MPPDNSTPNPSVQATMNSIDAFIKDYIAHSSEINSCVDEDAVDGRKEALLRERTSNVSDFNHDFRKNPPKLTHDRAAWGRLSSYLRELTVWGKLYWDELKKAKASQCAPVKEKKKAWVEYSSPETVYFIQFYIAVHDTKRAEFKREGERAVKSSRRDRH
ncbi:hypothetical protein EJ06DRAFT_534539 [Trichodelitschia bisporula]|uniref:Uncharacterized protein n=1 Tax=Trichodelitschia bisporula TaxID=703511 RepID=A0A6G1HIX5_9PEZI|nr:hypothetical protein EJ06DRAFT_534539 [Trichodelitschia bisporula]